MDLDMDMNTDMDMNMYRNMNLNKTLISYQTFKDDVCSFKGQSHEMFKALFKYGLLGLGQERNR
jgi:hypothetical protein